MASPYTRTTEIAGPVNVVFQKNLLRNAKPRCPYFIGSTPASIAEHEGSFTAKWRRYNNLTPVTTALAELTGNISHPVRDAVQQTVTDVTKAVAKYGNHLLLNEEVDLINFNNQSMKLSEVLGINAGQSLNRLQRDELEDNATQIMNNGAAAVNVNTILAKGKIRHAVNVIKGLVATEFMPRTTGNTSVGTSPIREAFWGICHYDVEEDIRDMTGFIAVEKYAGQTQTASGEFGAVSGVRFIASSEGTIDLNVGAVGGTDVRQTTASKADLYYTIILGKDAVGSLGLGSSHLKEIYQAGDKLPAVMMINHPRGSSGIADPYNEVSTLAWKSWHGAKILNADWIRTIISAATDLSN